MSIPKWFNVMKGGLPYFFLLSKFRMNTYFIIEMKNADNHSSHKIYFYRQHVPKRIIRVHDATQLYQKYEYIDPDT